jgi:hypothetical protein
MMFKKYVERYSFIILFLLIITSLFQVGILWNYQNHGVPIVFFRGFNRKNFQVERIDMDDFFKPYQLTLLNGYDEPSVVIRQDSEVFGGIWGVLRDHTRDLLIDHKFLSRRAYSDEVWGSFLISPGILVKFHTSFHAELIKAFLDIEEAVELDFTGMTKILFSEVNETRNFMDVYITDYVDIYQYRFDLYKNIYESIYLELNLENENILEDLSGFSLLQEIFPNTSTAPFNFRPDISVYMIGEKFVKVNDLDISLPEWILRGSRELKYVNQAASDILGEDRYSYHADIDESGNIVLGNVNHIYRIGREGLLEYKYLGESNQQTGTNFRGAFEVAVEFIGTRNFLNDLKNLYVASMAYDPNEMLYSFTFDYAIGDHLVVFEDPESPGYKRPFIQITTDGSRVIHASMIARVIRVSNQIREYDMGFKNLTSILFANSSIDQLKSLKMEDVFLGFIQNEMQQGTNNPHLLIRTFEDGFYPLALEKRGEDHGVE